METCLEVFLVFFSIAGRRGNASKDWTTGIFYEWNALKRCAVFMRSRWTFFLGGHCCVDLTADDMHGHDEGLNDPTFFYLLIPTSLRC